MSTRFLYIYGILVGIVLGLSLSMALAGEKEADIKCYPNSEFMKMIDEKALVTLYNGMAGNKVHEVMMTKDRFLYIVEYDKASDGNALQAKQYCVTGILSDVTFNDSAIEFLSKLLDKYKGQKT